MTNLRARIESLARQLLGPPSVELDIALPPEEARGSYAAWRAWSAARRALRADGTVSVSLRIPPPLTGSEEGA